MSKYVGLPYTKGSATSEAAAESMVEPSKNQRQRVWEFIYSCGTVGATCEEVERALDMRHQSCSTRMQELRRLGRLKYLGETRKTIAKREAEVHVAIDPTDWTDKRPGWPCPKKQTKNDQADLWRHRALVAKKKYYELKKEYEQLVLTMLRASGGFK